MGMNIRTIIDEANVRIPNSFSDAQKVNWLNECHNEFFDIVKIPVTWVTACNGTNSFTAPANMREKNIRKVLVNTEYYRSINFEDIAATMNYFILDGGKLILNPTPADKASLLVIYDKVPETTFSLTKLNNSPDAPEEYHWIYVIGLCSRIAKAQNDVTLANNYENDYKNALAIAQQNFIR